MMSPFSLKFVELKFEKVPKFFSGPSLVLILFLGSAFGYSEI